MLLCFHGSIYYHFRQLCPELYSLSKLLFLCKASEEIHEMSWFFHFFPIFLSTYSIMAVERDFHVPTDPVKEPNSEEHPGSSCVKYSQIIWLGFFNKYRHCVTKCLCGIMHTELPKDLSIRQTSKSTLIQVMIHPIFARLTGE